MARPRREEPVLRKRENGVWYAFWRDDERGHERKQSMDTRDHVQAATRFAEFLVRGPDDPRARKSLPGLKPTVEQVLDWYDRDHVSTVASPERQRYAIAPLKSFFKDKTIDEIDIDTSRAYVAFRKGGLSGRAVGRSTIRRELGVLVAAGNHALRWKRIGADDLPQVELPSEDAGDKAPWLTKASIRIIFDKADVDLGDFCRLAYYWGSRRNAVERLRRVQVDLQHGRVDLHPPLTRRTKKRKPIVPIYPEIRKLLNDRLNKTNDYLFPERRGNNGRAYANFYESFKRLCETHNITAVDGGDDVPWPHLLRHSRATHMLMDGESIYKVAKLLGDTVATVERVYGHHSAEYLATTSGVEEVA